MKMKLLVSLIVLSSISLEVFKAEKCDEQQRLMATHGICNADSNIICRDLCTGDIVSSSNCSTEEHCCLNGSGVCVLRQVKIDNSTIISPSDLARFFKAIFLVDLNNSSIGSHSRKNPDDEAEGRNFQFGTGGGGVPSYFPGNAINSCPKFPQNCPFELIHSENLNAPVNIPYCQRIACSPTNPFLDSDFKSCVSQPGCYFDQELSAYRNIVGQAILPQVPVCHLVIRNKAFQNRAIEAIQQYGSPWNPLLTQCLLREYDEEIFGEAVGCQLLDYLEYFGHRPKRAGWLSINQRDCALIGACWRSSDAGSYCAYPVNARGQPTVRSSNDREERLGENDLYGQPLCVPFSSTAIGAEFLSNYHTCLKTGCAIGVGRQSVWDQLINVGSDMPYPMNVHYISMVYAGAVRPDNYPQMIRQLQTFPLHNLVDSILPSVDLINIFPYLLNTFNESQSIPFPQSPTGIGNTGIFGGVSNLFPFLSGGAGLLPPNNAMTGSNQFPFLSGFLNPTLNDPCPYQMQQFSYPGLPLLSGSFEGCCEKPLCYTPRSHIRSTFSGLSSYVYFWSSWGACSQSCGGGVKNRTRVCVGDQCDSSSILLQTQTCNEQQCPYFLEWGAWSDCSASCGGGYNVRTRVCEGAGICVGESGESQLCQTGECPEFEFGQWSFCSNTCGVGIRTRTRICIYDGAYGCPPELFDEAPCEQFCGSSSVLCNVNTCCYEQTCLQLDGSPGHCETDNRIGLPCRIGLCWFRQSQCRSTSATLSNFSMG